MSKFPEQVWDGATPNRPNPKTDTVNPDHRDMRVLTDEIQSIQSALLEGRVTIGLQGPPGPWRCWHNALEPVANSGGGCSFTPTCSSGCKFQWPNR